MRASTSAAFWVEGSAWGFMWALSHTSALTCGMWVGAGRAPGVAGGGEVARGAGAAWRAMGRASPPRPPDPTSRRQRRRPACTPPCDMLISSGSTHRSTPAPGCWCGRRGTWGRQDAGHFGWGGRGHAGSKLNVGGAGPVCNWAGVPACGVMGACAAARGSCGAPEPGCRFAGARQVGGCPAATPRPSGVPKCAFAHRFSLRSTGPCFARGVTVADHHAGARRGAQDV
jgi:hypothetical protein